LREWSVKEKRSQRAPTRFGKAGKRLWTAVTDGLTFRPDELAVLESACRTADQVAGLEATLAGAPTMIAGSTGQLVLHPAIAELRLQRQLLASLLGRLDVPEVDAIGSEWENLTNSQRARKAARARWSA
jgi:hypothetical protein